MPKTQFNICGSKPQTPPRFDQPDLFSASNQNYSGGMYAKQVSSRYVLIIAALYAWVITGPLWEFIGFHELYIAVHIGKAEALFLHVLQPTSVLSFFASEPAWKIILYGLSVIIYEDSLVLRIIQFYFLAVFAYFLLSRAPKNMWPIVFLFLASTFVLNHISTARHFLALAFALQALMLLDRVGLKSFGAHVLFLLSMLTHYHFVFVTPLVYIPYLWLNRYRFSAALQVVLLVVVSVLFLGLFIIVGGRTGIGISPEIQIGGNLTRGIGWLIMSILILGIILLSRGMSAHSPHALIFGALYIAIGPFVAGQLASRTLTIAIPFLVLAICHSRRHRSILILLSILLVASQWVIIDWPVNFSTGEIGF